jgi:aclacinomycin oxidase
MYGRQLQGEIMGEPSTKHAVRSNLRASADRIGPTDPRYADLIRRGLNKRFTGKPDYVRLVGSTEQVADALQEAVAEGQRIAVRSGGYCLEGFVGDPEVRVVLDTSLMTDIAYDAHRGAFAVEAGATVGDVCRKLFLGWGVMLPAGESPNIGIGGHILGGAFGFFCREHGLAADHLDAVELVIVDGDGHARTVIATREPSDPNHDLFWAHTGGGGGNFGVVTRYWLRSPGKGGSDPSFLLPRAPESVVTFRASWSWEDIDERAFATLARNFGTWCERHSSPDAPEAKLFSILFLQRKALGTIEIKGVTTAGAAAEELAERHLRAVNEGVGARFTQKLERSTWLAFVLNPFPELFGGVSSGEARFKIKDAFFRKRPSDEQIATAYRYLTRTDHDVVGGVFGLATYGGKINTVAPSATASPQRDSILTTACNVGWGTPDEEAKSLAWLRPFYRDLFADAGGAPVPGERYDGAMINHPDADLADPAWNTTGVPWHRFYYKDNYPRLQQIKARWDPRNVFRHALSIRGR